jgi:hypothetical protein
VNVHGVYDDILSQSYGGSGYGCVVVGASSLVLLVAAVRGAAPLGFRRVQLDY